MEGCRQCKKCLAYFEIVTSEGLCVDCDTMQPDRIRKLVGVTSKMASEIQSLKQAVKDFEQALRLLETHVFELENRVSAFSSCNE